MLRRMGVAAVVVLALGGFVIAETVRGTITKVDEDGKSFELKLRAKKGETAETITVKFTKDTKWTKKKSKDDEGTAVEMKDVKKMLKDAGKAGVNVSVEHEDKTASAVTFTAGKGKGKKKKVDD